MFERYTEGARRTLFFARYEAMQVGSITIETEHLLLGVIRDGGTLTRRIFAHSHVSLEDFRKEVASRTISQERLSALVEIPFSAETKRVLHFGAEEADRLLHDDIGPEHLLLGMLREERSVAASALIEKGLRLQTVREVVVQPLKSETATRAAEHIVLVQVTVRPEMLEEFERALLHNARQSVKIDRGCLRFDVSQNADDPTQWVLHEVYTDSAAHLAHRGSQHFLAYEEVASRAIAEKTVVRCIGRHIVP